MTTETRWGTEKGGTRGRGLRIEGKSMHRMNLMDTTVWPLSPIWKNFRLASADPQEPPLPLGPEELSVSGSPDRLVGDGALPG